LQDYFFYFLSAVLLTFAVVTVTAKNLFRTALSLLGVLLSTAILFLLLSAEMVALVQVMVYIGGIMIFVLYAVLLTSQLGGKMPKPSWLKLGSATVAAGAVGTFLIQVLNRTFLSDKLTPTTLENASKEIASLQGLGLRLLDRGPNGFLVQFELISILLLAAMVGAIALARQGGKAP